MRAEFQKLLKNSSYLIVGTDLLIEQSDISIYKDIYDNLLTGKWRIFCTKSIRDK
jgi:hypothetical protein